MGGEADAECATDKRAYVEYMREFTTTNRSIVSISTTLLVLPITIIRAIRPNEGIPLDCSLILAWCLLGLSVLSGLSYQLIATRKIAHTLGEPGCVSPYFDRPVLTYNLSIGGFIFGLACLVYGLISVNLK